ncbi:MAG: hypothetical protein LBP30_03975 [Clostridiales Family XIII bacterium]|nr:hypothetical protein [Clostridiales Family XIII bacterium]
MELPQADRFTPSDSELTKRKNALAKLRALRSEITAKHKEIEAILTPMELKAKEGLAKVEDAISDDVAGVQSFFVPPAETEGEKLESDKKRAGEQLRALAMDADCPKELKSEALFAAAALSQMHSKERLNTFQAVTIRPLQGRIEAAIAKKQSEKNECAALRTRLVVLRSVAGMEQGDPPDDDDLDRLKTSVAELEKRIVAQTERAYIGDCVHAVMSEMGYDVIGERSVVKKSGKRFRSELFSYGDGTAINVTYDSEGRIAMELGGIDGLDRMPTEEEADVLREEMESFCSDFKVFEERLEAKGVGPESRVSMAPPSAEYATIINLADYTITSSAQAGEIALAVAEKPAKATAKRAMRKEDGQ